MRAVLLSQKLPFKPDFMCFFPYLYRVKMLKNLTVTNHVSLQCIQTLYFQEILIEMK